MRIAVLNPFFLPYKGGVEFIIHAIGKRLAKRHDLNILTSHMDGCPASETIDKIYVHRLRTLKAPLYNPPLTITVGLRKKLRELEPDIMHLHYRWAMEYARAAALYRKATRTPLVYNANNTLGEGGNFLRYPSLLYDKIISMRLFGQCDSIIALSRFVAEQLAKRGVEAERITVIPNGVEEVTPMRPSKENVITFMGRLVELKGLKYAIKAMPAILKEVPDARLMIAGEGPDRKRLEMYAKLYGVQKEVEFCGFVSGARKKRLMERTKVLMLPSIFEAAGLVSLEAMACGRPVVASNTGGIPEYVVDGKTGFLTRPADEKDIAEKVAALLKDDKLRRKFGRAALSRAAQFRWDVISRRIEKLYCSLA